MEDRRVIQSRDEDTVGAKGGRIQAGLIGRQIAKSLSPALHESEGRALGLDYSYYLFDLDELPAGETTLPRLLDILQSDGLAGCNVTYPVKQTIMPLLDSLSREADAIGAVNTVRFLPDGRREGHNTDWWGFGENLQRALPDAKMARIVLLGAGGAGAAAAYAVCRAGVGELVIFDADADRAGTLARRLSSQGFRVRDAALDSLERELAGADGLIQATPIGMRGRPGSPVSAALLDPRLWVAEIVYVPLETQLLREARARGCRTVDGGGMVVLQAARAIEVFTGVSADGERMRRHFEALQAI